MVCSQAGISSSFRQDLLYQLSLIETDLDLFDPFNRRILYIYKYGLLFGAHKIKGYNFVFDGGLKSYAFRCYC